MSRFPNIRSPLLAALLLMAANAAGAEDWPQHLGQRRDGTSTEQAPEAWGPSGPPVLWRQEVGEGFSAPVVAAGRLFLFHRQQGVERLDALDPKDGRLRWSYRYPTRYRDDFGFDEGPRAAPTVSGETVYTFGAQGVLSAVDIETGAKRWSVDTHEAFKVKKGFFGASASPLVEDGRVLLNVGGDGGAGIVAFDAATGRTLWTTSKSAASYSSAVVVRLGGTKTALFFTREGLSGVDPDVGTLRFEHRWRSRSGSSVNAATPLVIGDRIFISSSYQTGAALLRLDGDRPVPIWTSDDVLSNHYSTSLYYDGHLYGFHGRQEYGPALRCVELETGEVKWKRERFGSGSMIGIGERILLLHEDGRLQLLAASPSRFELLATTQLLSSVVRALPAFSDGVLYARNQRELIVVRLR